MKIERGKLSMESNLFSLKGKTAVVTGAAKGLGNAMATAMATQGANLVVADVDEEAGKRAVSTLRNMGVKAIFCKMDVRNQEEIDAMVLAACREFGTIDILVNNAGIGKPGPSDQVTRTDWQEVIDINLTGVFFVAQAVGRVMIAQGKGSIINIASMSAMIVNRSVPQSSYYASKAGVVMLTKSLAAEWACHGIRVNAIAPGVMLTEQTDFMFKDPSREEQVRLWMAYTPMGRAGNPPELGGAVVYLASDASSFMTGHVMVVDGGYTVY
jgi:NAD(P)-dependent dehydrogenase (short-subunit alcohol dehydrogenase family)